LILQYRGRTRLPRPGGKQKTGPDIKAALLLGLTSLSVSGLAFAQPQPKDTPLDVGGGGPTGIQITPSIGVNQLYTDNQTGTGGSQPQFVTQISPGLAISGQTARAKIDFNYQPTFNHYENGNTEDRVDQNLNTDATITPFTDNLTVRVQGYANEFSAGGNASNQAGILVPSNNRILYYIGNVVPRYQQNFSDVATLEASYSVNSTNTSVEGQKFPGLNSTNSLGRNALVSIGSAEAFGRLGLRADFGDNTSSGSGANTQSTSDFESVTISSHVNRSFFITASIDYQTINYPNQGIANPGYQNSGVTWSLGVTFTPNELSSLSFGYGRSQGAYSPSVQVGYAIGPRTNISASYVVSVQNQLTSTLQNLRYLIYDQFGNPIDSRTGLPFSPVNQTFGSQNILFRDKPALISISHQFERSSVTLTGQYEVRNSLSGIQIDNEVTSGTVNYTRQFSPLMQGNVSLGYTQSKTRTFGSADNSAHSYSLTGQLLYNLSDTASINIIENLFRTINNDSQQNSLSQQLTIGFRKSF